MKDLQVYVGTFVKTNDGQHFGMIDAVYTDERLGFVWSDKDSWTGELVKEDNISICESGTDIERAVVSASTYFEREKVSLECRIERKIKGDDSTKLRALLSDCEYWLSRLS